LNGNTTCYRYFIAAQNPLKQDGVNVYNPQALAVTVRVLAANLRVLAVGSQVLAGDEHANFAWYTIGAEDCYASL
jgi:hypothetical protein